MGTNPSLHIEWEGFVNLWGRIALHFGEEFVEKDSFDSFPMWGDSCTFREKRKFDSFPIALYFRGRKFNSFPMCGRINREGKLCI